MSARKLNDLRIYREPTESVIKPNSNKVFFLIPEGTVVVQTLVYLYKELEVVFVQTVHTRTNV